MSAISVSENQFSFKLPSQAGANPFGAVGPKSPLIGSPKVITPDLAPNVTPNATPNLGCAKRPDKVDIAGRVPQGSSLVEVDGWKKGKNDCLEHILLNKGYSLKEIYTKDQSGRTLAQRIAADNGLKDPNLLRAGQQLIIPSKSNSKSVSTEGLKRDQSSSVSIKNQGIAGEKTASRNADGKDMHTEIHNGAASFEQDTHVGRDGRIDGTVRKSKDGVDAYELAKNGRGDAMTESVTAAGPKGSRTVITDKDRTANMKVKVTEDGLVAENPGAGDSVKTASHDNKGLFETLGSWGDKVARWTVGQKRSTNDLDVSGAKRVEEQRNSDGSRLVTVTRADGSKVGHYRDADWAGQRGGRKLDEGISAITDWAKKLVS